MKPSLAGPHHLALLVFDIPRAQTFYADVLGLPVLKKWLRDDQSLRSVWMDLGHGRFLALEQAESEDSSSSIPTIQPFQQKDSGWHLFALTIEVKDREIWKDHFRRNEIPIVHESAYTIYIQDPEGNRLGLSHYPESAK